MPVDLFPEINIPGCGGRDLLRGMPPQQIEADITDSYERFFTWEAESITSSRDRCPV